MTYLILQILFCLIIAFIFGFLLGWLFGRSSCKKNQITQPYVPPTRAQTPPLAAAMETTKRSYAPPPPLPVKEAVKTPPPPPPMTVAPKPAPAPIPAPAPKPAPTPAPVQAAAPVRPTIEAHLSTEGYEIETLEGVGPKTGTSLREIGIATISDFLQHGAAPAERSKIASSIAVRPKMVDSWASMSDLLRIKGLDHQAAELIHKSGINTVTDLSQQNVATFSAKMEAVNTAGKRSIAPEVPSSSLMTDWISQASGMKSVIEV